MKFLVSVKTRTKKSEIVETPLGTTAHLKSAPVNGKANEELIDLLSDHYDVSPSRITIKSGMTSQKKLIEIRED
jgi:uncharacterized protein YggU (UPF0235/DUF167 family)